MDGNTEHPVPFPAFAKTLVGTPDQIWTKLLQMRYGRQNHTPTEWRGLIDAARDEPAHPLGMK